MRVARPIRTQSECQQEVGEHRYQRMAFLYRHKYLRLRDMQVAEDVASVQDFHDVWDDYEREGR